MYFDGQGIDLNNWNLSLQKGETTAPDGFIRKTEKLNLRNSLFVDNTANQEMATTYEKFLQKGIGIYADGKILQTKV